MSIYDALLESHQKQRRLSDLLVARNGADDGLAKLFDELKAELQFHAASEERFFYVPLLEHDETQGMARHSISEHHEIDEMIDELEQTQATAPDWKEKAAALRKRVHHHLEEEEEKIFPGAKEVLGEAESEELERGYRGEIRERASGEVETRSSVDV